MPGVMRYVTATDIPAGGQNNALSSEFFEPEEVLVNEGGRGAEDMHKHVGSIYVHTVGDKVLGTYTYSMYICACLSNNVIFGMLTVTVL